ncbi:MAG: flagellar hook-associated protein FlgK [Deltaproteobacteria bacterium]|nr:MAG: flagellar hook-associated protein FlgK [Deltaproteobacteria bacterium]
MAGLFDALNAGKSSLSTNQKAIEIVGNNVANVNSEGYSRQRAELVQVPAVNFGGFFIGQGVTVSDVSRDYNSFISNQLQESYVNLGEESGRSRALTELERLFNVSEDNLASEIDDFFDAWQELTANPSGEVERDVVIQRGNLLGTAFKNLTEELDTIVENMNTEIIGEVEALNEKIAEIAELNDRIRTVEMSGQTANAARDQRDLLVQDLTETLGVQTFMDNQAMVSVSLPGGLPLVQGNIANTLSTEINGSNVGLTLNMAGVTMDVGINQLGGKFYGMYDVRDNLVGGLYDDLDTLAVELTSSVNDIHVNGYYTDPATGLPATGLLFFNDITSVPPPDRASRAVAVAFSDGDYVAAASLDTAAPGDNGTALTIAALETTYTLTGTSDNYDAFFSKLVSRVGIEASRNAIALEGAEDATMQLQNLRDGYSGVSLEEEMIDLIQYQRGFESSAKFLSTVDEMMSTLIQIKS